MAHAYDRAGPKAKEILWKTFEVKLHKFMTAKNIPESGFYTKQYPQHAADQVDGTADEEDSDCEMLSELSATDTIDMVDNDDDDDDLATDDSTTTKLDVLKDACVEILKIQPPITEEEDMVS